VAALVARWKPEGRNSLLDTVNRLPREYELMTILIPDVSEEETQSAIERVTGYVTDMNAELTETLTDSPWGRRRLAYAIRHEGVDYRDGFYVVMRFTAAPNSITDIERELKLDTSVIRYLLVSFDPKAGEQNNGQTEGEVTDGAEAPAEEAVPAVEDAAAESAAELTPVDAPAAGTEAAVVEEVAEAIEGENEPAPADGAESDNEES
jgi:small subunit ribosomal protein S6